MGPRQTLKGSVSLGLEILYALGLVENDEIRFPGGDRGDIPQKGFVVGNLENSVGLVIHLPPFIPWTGDNLCSGIGKLFDLPFPLALYGGGADDNIFSKPKISFFMRAMAMA